MMKKSIYAIMALAGILTLLGGCTFLVTPAQADDAADAAQLVQKANMTFENFLTAKEMEPFRDLVKKARGVFVAPDVLKGAFIIGVSGGSGVLMARDPKTHRWSDPAFYTMGELSIGLQAGGKSSDIVLLAMTERGVNAFLETSVKLGANVGVAAGPVGVGATAATENISADILSFARSQGAYAGISVEGAVVKTRNDWNRAYYGKEVTPKDILIARDVHNPAARPLVGNVTKASTVK